MERVRMELEVTRVLAKVDIQAPTAKQVNYKIIFKFEMPTTPSLSHSVVTQDFFKQLEMASQIYLALDVLQ